MGWAIPQVVNLFPELKVTMPVIRTIIADQDSSTRKQLRSLLSAEPGLEVVAECADGIQTVAAVQTYKPDLLLLDIHLPRTDGFEVLHSIPGYSRPSVIFMSALDQYATRAFEARALDYLLKPFEPQRVSAAIERARAELLNVRDRHLTHRLLDLLADAKAESKTQKRLAVRTGGRVVLLVMDEIDWVEASGNYVKLQSGTESYLVREAISRIAERLDPAQFVRIHRSIIVNIKKIKELQPCNRGEYMVILKDGKELSCSRGYRDKLQQLITKA